MSFCSAQAYHAWHSDGHPKILLSFRFMKAVVVNSYYDGRLQPPAFKQSDVTLNSKAGTSYLNPLTRMFTIVLRRDRLTSIKQLDVVAVGMGLNVDFVTFFGENNVDPVVLPEEFKKQIPPDYEKTYDPTNLVREDPFIRNMAAVLQINPDRLKVTRIVPGNRRRRRRMMASMGLEEEEIERRMLQEGADEGLDLEFQISEVDVCATVDCGDNGECDSRSGRCMCLDGLGVGLGLGLG